MPYTYKPLWVLIAQRELNKTDFRHLVGISTNTLAKLSSNKPVSMDILDKICKILGCEVKDIMEYQSDISNSMNEIKNNFKDCGYTLFADQWPECRFVLNKSQIENLNHTDIENAILKCEHLTNTKYHINILGSTEVEFSQETSELIIKGSYDVTERFIKEYIIEKDGTN